MAQEKCRSSNKEQNQIISPRRRKVLMKKLAKIKSNRSRENNSFFDFTAHYETKVRKLKSNNVSLAKALADQRQISQTWYDEVVSIKEELHHSQESLLRCRVRENDEYDHIIQAAVQRRMKAIAAPLEGAVKDALDNVCSLVDNLTKVKQILSSGLAVNKDQLNCSRSSSQGSSHSRPPLSRTPKSPRKNVVHPMVEGHVLQPASIHIPRMSLEDRRRYRLQERAEIREDAGMSAISEQSSLVMEDEPSAEDSEPEAITEIEVPEVQLNGSIIDEVNNSVEVTSLHCSSPTSNSEELITNLEAIPIIPRKSESDEVSLQDVESNDVELAVPDKRSQDSPEKVSGLAESPPFGENNAELCTKEEIIQDQESQVTTKKVKQVVASDEASQLCKSNTDDLVVKISEQESEVTLKIITKGKHKIDSEDPLEGSSWMHTKRKRNSKKKKSNNKTVRTSGMHFLLSSSDSEEEEDEKKEKVKLFPLRVKQVKIKGMKQEVATSPNSEISTPPHIDLLNSRVSRRSKKQSRGSTISKTRTPKGRGNDQELGEESRAIPLESFIIRDDCTNNLSEEAEAHSEARVDSESEALKSDVVIPTPLSTETPNSELPDEDTPDNVTCLLNSPMEMTECLPKDLLLHLNATVKSPTISKVNCKNGDKLKTPESPILNFKMLPASEDDSLYKNKEANVIANVDSNLLNTNKQTNVPTGKRRSNKFFKCCEEDITKEVKPTGRTPFDISLLDAVVDPCYFKLGKENVPPNTDDKTDLNISEAHMKLKNISIVVEDIMKTSSTPTSPELLSSLQGMKVSSNLFSSGKSKSAKLKDTSKRKGARKDESPNRKVVKKHKKLNFSAISSPSSIPSDDDVWSPSKKNGKRKRKTKISVKKKSKVPDAEVPAEALSPCSLVHVKKEMNSKIDKQEIATTKDEVVITTTKSNNIEINSNMEYISWDYMLEKNENGPLLTNIYEDVNNLIKMNIEHCTEEVDPLAINIDLEDDEDDDIQVIETKFFVDTLDNCSGARPRRAAAKIASFKEPSLNVKLRRNSIGKKPPRKKISKKSLPVNKV